MRKIIFVSLTFAFLVASFPIMAQTTSSSTLKQGSPSASSNLLLSKTLESLSARLKAGVSRAEKISGRIVTRLTKMQTGKLTSSNTNLAALLVRQKDFAVSIEQIKIDLTQLDLSAQILATSSSPKKDYPVFKNQVLLFTKNLKDIYKKEIDLISDMKQVASVTAAASVSAAPTQ